MIVFDTHGNPIETYDLTAGHIVESTKTIHHDAVAAVAEQSHYETVAEYPNGGKDVKLVVDVAGVQARDAYDEEQPLYTYIPYTAEELAQIEGTKSAPTDAQRLAAVEAALLELVLGGVSGG
jgi:hypothetical protein